MYLVKWKFSDIEHHEPEYTVIENLKYNDDEKTVDKCNLLDMARYDIRSCDDNIVVYWVIACEEIDDAQTVFLIKEIDYSMI